MFENIRQFPVLLVLLFSLLFPAAAYAEWPGFGAFIELGAGVEDLHLSDSVYDSNNIGPGFSISPGIQIAFFSLLIQQDLGFIFIDPPANYVMQENDKKRKRSFKGGTFLTSRWSFPFIQHNMVNHNQMLGAGPFVELGLGAIYMKMPVYQKGKDDLESKFGLRLGAGFDLAIVYDFSHCFLGGSCRATVFKVGLLFEYTWGVASHNMFDNKHAHFIGTKLIFAFFSH